MDWCLQKLVDDFAKEANQSPDENDLVPKVRSKLPHWKHTGHQSNDSLTVVSIISEPGPAIRHARMDRFGNLDLCVHSLMATCIKAHMRKIKSIQLNRSKFFLDPLRWICNNQSPLDSDGCPDFATDLPMSNEVEAERFMLQLQSEHDILQARLGRTGPHIVTWDDISPTLRAAAKRTMRVQDIPAPVLELLRDKILSEQVVPIASTTTTMDPLLGSTVIKEEEQPPTVTPDESAIEHQEDYDPYSSDESDSKPAAVADSIARARIHESRLIPPPWAIKPGKGEPIVRDVTMAEKADDIADLSHPFGSKVRSPQGGATRNLKRDLDQAATRNLKHDID
jgi:hypothetical protein